jgi:hypothetical protein
MCHGQKSWFHTLIPVLGGGHQSISIRVHIPIMLSHLLTMKHMLSIVIITWVCCRISQASTVSKAYSQLQRFPKSWAYPSYHSFFGWFSMNKTSMNRDTPMTLRNAPNPWPGTLHCQRITTRQGLRSSSDEWTLRISFLWKSEYVDFIYRVKAFYQFWLIYNW